MKSPEVAQPSVGPDFHQPLQVFQSLLSRALARIWLCFLSITSFCLFKSQSGILYWCGFCIMVITCSTSSSVSSPALLVRSMSAFLNTTWAYLHPIPITAVIAKAIFRCPSILVLRTRKMCWNFSRITRDMAAAPVVACRPPVEKLTSSDLWHANLFYQNPIYLFSFVTCTFGVISEKTLPNPRSWRFIIAILTTLSSNS